MGDMEDGDAVFGSSVEVDLGSQVYWWHDKYKPRKPKYFNRVDTRYKWNKYNQTHYDHDNPPPKIVQGASSTKVKHNNDGIPASYKLSKTRTNLGGQS
ncbi:hypothetical protein JHK82_050943 [Glycine max]|nr:hypothetical protein JHK86_050800 [Glycine max]KAG5092165.1 hypothetical protein JHK82_050943 [Glycine max]